MNLEIVCQITVFTIFLSHNLRIPLGIIIGRNIMSLKKSRKKSVADENTKGIDSNLRYFNTLRNLNLTNSSVACRGAFLV